MAVLQEYVHGSCIAEDSQTEIYYKRKGWEHQKSVLPKDQLSHQDLKEHGYASSENSDSFPKKKPKLGSPQYQSHIDGDYRDEYVLALNEGNFTSMQRSDTGGSDGDNSEPSLLFDLRSPRSMTSSRSSSHPPEYGTPTNALLGDLTDVQPSLIYDSMILDEDSAPTKTLAENLPLTHLSIPSCLPCPARVCNVIVEPTKSFDRSFAEEVQSARDNENLDQSSFTRSSSPSNGSHPAPSSFSESEDPSTEGDKSSRSQPSSAVSDSVTSDDSSDSDQGSSLQSVIRTVLRTDPDVADLLFRALDGRLECAPANHSDYFEESGGLDLLSMLELQDSRTFQDCEVYTTHGSSTGSSTQNKGSAIQPSSGGSSFGSGSAPIQKSATSPNENSGQLVKSQKNNAKSNSPPSPRPHYFRCVHNALAPEIFCVNHDTQEKFRPCAGPGYSSIQHLKEHMQSHHTKKPKKPNPLQCTRCQEGFKDQDLLKRHEMNVDCPIRCPDCPEEFEKKAMRQAHQEERHLEEMNDSRFMEINEATEKKIKENLKAYVDSSKKGKGSTDETLEKWIEANTRRYMIGRPSKPNPKLELGQWYIIYKTLASDAEVPEHPFYDYGLTPSDLAAEKILLINDKLIDARIRVHGPPPAELQTQRDWYRDVLRESLQVATKTRLAPQKKPEPSSEQQNPTQSSKTSYYPQGPSTSRVQGSGYNTEIIEVPYSMNAGFQMTANHEPQVSRMNNHHLALALEPSNFLQNVPQQSNQMTAPSSNLVGEASPPSNMMPGEMADIDNWQISFEQDMTMSEDATGELFNEQHNFTFTEDYNVQFQGSGSEMLANTQGPSFWHKQQGKG